MPKQPQKHIKVTKEDIKRMIKQYGLSLKDLQRKLNDPNKYEAKDKKKLYKLILPFLLSREQDDDDAKARSFKQEQEEANALLNPDLLDMIDREIPAEELLSGADAPLEEMNRELLDILANEDLMVDNLIKDPREEYEHREKRKLREKRKELEEKISHIMALVAQYKTGEISTGELIRRVDRIIPLKHNPPIVEFLRQNNIDIKQQTRPAYKKTRETAQAQARNEQANEYREKPKTRIMNLADLTNELLKLDPELKSHEPESPGLKRGDSQRGTGGRQF